MEAILDYTLKASIGLLVLYLFYYTVLRSQHNFGFNRLYLLLAPPVALLLPLLTWPAAFSSEAAVTQALQAIQLQEITVTAWQVKPATATNLSLPLVLSVLYAAGVIFVLGKLAWQLWQIRLVKHSVSTTTTINGALIYSLNSSYPSFAFGKSIFLSKQQHLNKTEQEQVLAHELAHVQFGHTWDVLFYEFLTAILWLQPLVWLMKQELRDVHEYQADAAVVQQHQPQQYTTLLSREVLLNMGLPIGSHFTKPQILKRLRMLQKLNQQQDWLRPLLTLPVLGALALLLAQPKAAALDASTATASKTLSSTSEQPATQAPPYLTSSDAKEIRNPAAALSTAPTAAKPAGEAAGFSTSQSATQPVSKSQNATDLPAAPAKIQPYTYVEQMPVFKSGEAEMIKFLGQNIKYPQEAQAIGAEGLVVLSMVIGADGSVQDVEIIKSVEPSIDSEAMRVVKAMDGKWQPGMQNGKAVPVRYMLPVRFAIK